MKPHLTNLIAQAVDARPDVNQLPGGELLQQFTDGIMGWGLVLSLMALMFSAAAWALGSNTTNHQYTVAGKRGVLVSGLAALLIGAAPAIINFFFSAGSAVR